MNERKSRRWLIGRGVDMDRVVAVGIVQVMVGLVVGIIVVAGGLVCGGG